MTVPTPLSVTNPLVESTVARAVLLLEYVTASGLAPVAVTVNAASVTFFVVGGFTNVRLIVAFETVSVLLVLVAALNRLVSAWAALNDTSPRPTIVIKLPEASMVATDVLLLLYVITPLLSLTGLVSIAKDASPYAFGEGIVNVADERLGVLREIRRLNVVLAAL
jgi:hypothetical protein